VVVVVVVAVVEEVESYQSSWILEESAQCSLMSRLGPSWVVKDMQSLRSRELNALAVIAGPNKWVTHNPRDPERT
jgi:hypothetical protein